MFATTTSRTLARSLLASSVNVSRPVGVSFIRHRWFSDQTKEETKNKNQDDEDSPTAVANYRKAAEAINEKHKDLDRSLYTKEIPIKMPDLGAGNGKILRWFKQPGDVIVYEDVLCDIETSDFTFGMEIEDEELGILKEINVPKGTIVEPETLICTLYHEKNSPDPEPEQPDEEDAPPDLERKIPVTFERKFVDETDDSNKKNKTKD